MPDLAPGLVRLGASIFSRGIMEKSRENVRYSRERQGKSREHTQKSREYNSVARKAASSARNPAWVARKAASSARNAVKPARKAASSPREKPGRLKQNRKVKWPSPREIQSKSSRAFLKLKLELLRLIRGKVFKQKSFKGVDQRTGNHPRIRL